MFKHSVGHPSGNGGLDVSICWERLNDILCQRYDRNILRNKTRLQEFLVVNSGHLQHMRVVLSELSLYKTFREEDVGKPSPPSENTFEKNHQRPNKCYLKEEIGKFDRQSLRQIDTQTGTKTVGCGLSWIQFEDY